MSLLLHACCGPCLYYPAKIIAEEERSFSVYFYNPNIHPYREFRARLTGLESLCSEYGWPLIADRDYGLRLFLRTVVFRESQRCSSCYQLRLEKTARYAAEHDFSAFSSTLFYSIYQNHTLMKSLSEDFGQQYRLSFYYRDFRKGWNEGIDMAIKSGIYRQKYCGCIYSEQERYDNRLKKQMRRDKANHV